MSMSFVCYKHIIKNNSQYSGIHETVRPTYNTRSECCKMLYMNVCKMYNEKSSYDANCIM